MDSQNDIKKIFFKENFQTLNIMNGGSNNENDYITGNYK